MKRRLCLGLGLLPLLAGAQVEPMRALLLQWQREAEAAQVRRAHAFVQRCELLAAQTDTRSLREALLAWEFLLGWPVGIGRQTQLGIDFANVRPARLQASAEAWDPASGEVAHLGADVRGLSALEQLLHPQPRHSAYAAAAARHLLAQAQALHAQVEARSLRSQSEDEVVVWRNQAVGAWVDGLDQLRSLWLSPRPGHSPPRTRSNLAREARDARWRALRGASPRLLQAIAMQTDVGVAAEGHQRVQALNAALDAAKPDARAAQALLAWMQQVASPALSVPPGFSDADGD